MVEPNDVTKVTLKLDDSRRLTGTNFFSDRPGVVLDAFVSGLDKQSIADAWLAQLEGLLNAVGWGDTRRFYRIYEDGVSLGFTAPVDSLYAATEINELAWERVCHQFLPDVPRDADDRSEERLRDLIKEEQDPALLALIAAAESNGIAYLVDDEFFSLGYGIGAEVWHIAALPALDSLDWEKYKTIPVALVTGTNGKSTSVRLISQIIKQAGLRCGVTSTDFIRVGDTLLDKGDFSGPGGARMLLRHPDTEVAVLEVARGGLLRRGLPIPQVDVALVTNVAEDHLGQYGINSIEALTAVKMLVAQAVDKELVLNADDTQLVEFVANSGRASSSDKEQRLSMIPQEPVADNLSKNITWFSLSESNPTLLCARENRQNVCFIRDGQIIYATADHETCLIDIHAIPMTLKGAALHNVQNALGAVALSKALDISDSAIRNALAQFRSDVSDNPGRGNLFDYQGAKIMLDFAHNVHSMTAMANTLRIMPAERKILLLCLPGDRSDEQVRALTCSAMAMQPDLLWICELPDYLRGRELGNLPKVIAAAVRETQSADVAVHFADSPLEGAEAIVNQLQANDLVFIMALSQRDQIAALVTN